MPDIETPRASGLRQARRRRRRRREIGAGTRPARRETRAWHGSQSDDTYLDEFVFRYNRRFYRHASFETMLGLAADHAPATYRDIVGRESPSKNQIAGDAQPLHVGEPKSAG